MISPPADLSPIEVQAFRNIGALGAKTSREHPSLYSCPFDKSSDGFIYGEASAALILETKESARNRGVSPLCEIKGIGVYLDQNSSSNPSVSSEIAAMKQALKMAQIKSEEINYLNTHGTSSPLGDQTELMAIKEVFGARIKTLWFNSTKSIFGHNLFSAALMEAIATIIQMKKNFIHPNINLNSPISNEFRFAPKKSVEASIDYAMSNSFGFGGINTSLILKRSP